MNYKDEKIIDCAEFERHLTDYLDKNLDKRTQSSVAAHALRCPLCHGLLNEVKDALAVCREISVPKQSLTKLEAGILSMTMPETAMSCREFEEHLTDYLDGFLPAKIFHRWERHAVLCGKCSDLPGEVVRSIAACYTYKLEEMPLPAGLHERILTSTLGTTETATVKSSTAQQFVEWIRGLSFPIYAPQFASVALMLIFAFFVLSQTVSADGSVAGVYQKSYELAEQTYRQSANVWTDAAGGEPKPETREPIQGIYVNQEEANQ